VSLVVFSLPTGISVLPFRLDETLCLKAMQDGIEHSLRPFEFAAREFLDALDQRVTVTSPPASRPRSSGRVVAAMSSRAGIEHLCLFIEVMSSTPPKKRRIRG
jgi:hypothetical protein